MTWWIYDVSQVSVLVRPWRTTIGESWRALAPNNVTLMPDNPSTWSYTKHQITDIVMGFDLTAIHLGVHCRNHLTKMLSLIVGWYDGHLSSQADRYICIRFQNMKSYHRISRSVKIAGQLSQSIIAKTHVLYLNPRISILVKTKIQAFVIISKFPKTS